MDDERIRLHNEFETKGVAIEIFCGITGDMSNTPWLLQQLKMQRLVADEHLLPAEY